MQERTCSCLGRASKAAQRRCTYLKFPLGRRVKITGNVQGCGCGSVNGAGAVCDQKTPKFFVSHQEESIAGHTVLKTAY
jgi:hypothetical protein